MTRAVVLYDTAQLVARPKLLLGWVRKLQKVCLYLKAPKRLSSRKIDGVTGYKKWAWGWTRKKKEGLTEVAGELQLTEYRPCRRRSGSGCRGCEFICRRMCLAAVLEDSGKSEEG